MFKTCSRCKKSKSVSEFYFHLDGYTRGCKRCLLDYQKHKRVSARKVYTDQGLVPPVNKNATYYRIRNTPEYKFLEYKRHAKERGLSFKLVYEDLLRYWNKSCAYCGDKIVGIGLDRLDSSQGYHSENITSCCWLCNRGKNNLSQSEFIQHCQKVARLADRGARTAPEDSRKENNHGQPERLKSQLGRL